jgi:hypothetical protein
VVASTLGGLPVVILYPTNTMVISTLMTVKIAEEAIEVRVG